MKRVVHPMHIYYFNKSQCTRNFSQKYQQNALLDTVFFEQ